MFTRPPLTRPLATLVLAACLTLPARAAPASPRTSPPDTAARQTLEQQYAQAVARLCRAVGETAYEVATGRDAGIPRAVGLRDIRAAHLAPQLEMVMRQMVQHVFEESWHPPGEARHREAFRCMQAYDR